MTAKRSAFRGAVAAFALTLISSNAAPVSGWLAWRGPEQCGVSRETGLPDKLIASNALWTADYPGQSTPVIHEGRLYINGYLGDAEDLQEAITCFDAETGREVDLFKFFENYIMEIIVKIHFLSIDSSPEARAAHTHSGPSCRQCSRRSCGAGRPSPAPGIAAATGAAPRRMPQRVR